MLVAVPLSANLTLYAVSKQDIKTVLVTGGAGFIGSHVTQALLRRGYRVAVVDNFNDYYSPQRKWHNIEMVRSGAQNGAFSLYQVDICDKKTFIGIVGQVKPAVICHLAAMAGVRYSSAHPDTYIRTNVQGMLNVLDAAKEAAVPHIVYASSSSVYGQDRAPFKEGSTADRPCSVYAATKRAGELLAYSYHHLYGISCTGLRLFTVYGPRGRPDMAPFKFLDAIHHGRPIQQYGDGTSMRDFTYIDDAVTGIIQAIETPLGYEVINLGRGEPVSLQSFITLVQETVGRQAHITRCAVPAGDVRMTHASIGKARTLLGYNPKVSLREGLRRMYRWYTDSYLVN